MYDVVVGRNEADRKKYGDKGTIFLGKHYVKMGRVTSLSNKVFIDVTRAHVFFIVGKRGSGKSYTMGVIAEGISDLPTEIKNNISVILLDTMGIYWTMKYANQKDKQLLKDWGLKSKSLDVKIYTPSGFYDDFKKKGIPTDYPFSISPSELDATDWCMSFGVTENSIVGVFIERIIFGLKGDEDIKTDSKGFTIKDILNAIESDKEFDSNTKNAAKNLFMNASNWGIFEKEIIVKPVQKSTEKDVKKTKLDKLDGLEYKSKTETQSENKTISQSYKATPLADLAKGGQVTILDLSCYATMPNSWNIKNLVVGLIAEKLFIQRMIARKDEEYSQIHKAINLFSDEQKKKFDFPMVWLVIDEAHEFLPVTGKTLATNPLVTILREGRQPGISLILATQQPGKIHTDVMTQADVVIAHRITAKLDTEALGTLMQSYMREGLTQQLDELPREKGAAIIFDDNNEKMYPIRLRPRFTWHGGEDPSAMPKKEDGFEEENEI